MADEPRQLEVALLALPEVSASTLYGMLDMLSSAGRDFSFITKGVPGVQRIRPVVVSRRREAFQASNGVQIQPDSSLNECTAPDIVCIPDFFIEPGSPLGNRFDDEIAWLRRCHASGAIMSSACSGAVLLAEAGLLDGLEATIHWGYVEALTAHYPRVKVSPAKALVATGEGHRIVLAGGGMTWQDLALYLIARFVGTQEAIEVARFYLVAWHDAGQLPYASLVMSQPSTDAVIGKCQVWLADNYACRAPVAKMAAQSGLPERSLARRFRKATGYSPLDYVHALRLEEAKQLLERSELSVDAIGEDVGYEEPSFFRRLFRRKVGMSPAAYRRRFAGLRSSWNLRQNPATAGNRGNPANQSGSSVRQE
jgi:transcriptional regulator GlxA family with amidase domain